MPLSRVHSDLFESVKSVNDLLILSDLDEVLSKTGDAVKERLISEGHIPDDNLIDILGAYRESEIPNHLKDTIDRIWLDAETYRIAEKNHQLCSAMEGLSRLHKPSIVTARPDTPEIRRVTIEWLQEKSIIFESLFLIGMKNKPVFYTDLAIQGVREGFEGVLVVEDNLEVAIGTARQFLIHNLSNVCVALVRRSYNNCPQKNDIPLVSVNDNLEPILSI